MSSVLSKDSQHMVVCSLNDDEIQSFSKSFYALMGLDDGGATVEITQKILTGRWQ
jgi:hypothetical protein